MIIITVHLASAITGKTTELARMHIANDGAGSAVLGNYDGQTFIGRNKWALDQGKISKTGRVEGYPRERLHVWNLVARMLKDMGYTK